MAWADDFVTELSKRYGVQGEASDVARLNEFQGGIDKAASDPTATAGVSTQAQLEEHKRKLEQQYQQRATNRPRGEAPDDAQPAQAAAQPSTPAQAWNQQPDPYPDWYRGLMERQVSAQEAQRAETKQRADALYGQLSQRAGQSLQVDATDPIVKGQVDAFRAENTRAKRDYLSDVAERSGPLANLRGEERMAAERLGQGVSQFQAELLGRELGARRQEIADALQMSGSLLSAEQQRGLQAQLAQMDQAIAEAGIGMQGRGLDLQRDLGFADLGLRRDLGFAGLDLQRTLGMGGLDLQRRGLDQGMDQFLRELALREWQLGDESDWRWSNL